MAAGDCRPPPGLPRDSKVGFDDAVTVRSAPIRGDGELVRVMRLHQLASLSKLHLVLESALPFVWVTGDAGCPPMPWRWWPHRHHEQRPSAWLTRFRSRLVRATRTGSLPARRMLSGSVWRYPGQALKRPGPQVGVDAAQVWTAS